MGEVPEELTARIESLPLEALEALGEALLDFATVEDLRNWLQANA